MRYMNKDLINDIFDNFYKYKKEYRNNIKEEEYKYIINKRKEFKNKNNNIKNKDDLMFLLFSKLNLKEKELIELKFKYKVSVADMCTLLFISESTYHRKMRKIYAKMSKYITEFNELFDIK